MNYYVKLNRFDVCALNTKFKMNCNFCFGFLKSDLILSLKTKKIHLEFKKMETNKLRDLLLSESKRNFILNLPEIKRVLDCKNVRLLQEGSFFF